MISIRRVHKFRVDLEEFILLKFRGVDNVILKSLYKIAALIHFSHDALTEVMFFPQVCFGKINSLSCLSNERDLAPVD